MNTETLTTAAVVLAAVMLGFVFGVEATGRLATAWLSTETAMLPQEINGARWIEQAHTLRSAAVGVFGVCAIGATALWVHTDE